MLQLSLFLLYTLSKKTQKNSGIYQDVTDEFMRLGLGEKGGSELLRYAKASATLKAPVMASGLELNTDTIKSAMPCGGSSTFLLVLVASPPKNHHIRSVVRLSWGAVKSHKGYTIKVLFYMGKPRNSSQQRELMSESISHNDIFQSEVADDRLTLKTLAAFQWAGSECAVARFVLKVDDDVFVNVRNAVDYLKYLTPEDESTLYQGYGVSKSPAFRNEGGKWYISYEAYKNDTYPPYILGFASLFSMKVVNDLHAASFKVQGHFQLNRDFPFDDVFIGICAKYLGINPTFQYTRFYHDPSSFEENLKKDECQFVQSIAAYGVDRKMFYYYLEAGEKIRSANRCV
ncbi:beta-1,3-galactosyltransferase 5-like [Lineus longissimus]|uniref:beta-1,3-galactosyltransferase 5-like n=1 Tax=Lineus longissimus TaxID=88925 RepID=UPI00315C597A